jgi:hypothetical protein
MSTLGIFRRNARPDDVRRCLLAYYQLLDASTVQRAALHASRAPLRECIAAACLHQDIERAITSARRGLRQAARHGGHGLDVGGGRSPPAMGHGCPALSAVGPAPMGSAGADTTPANRSFLGQPGKELPAGRTLNIIGPRAGRGEV